MSIWVPESSLAGFVGRHEMALELVCRADFWCNLHCKTSPVDLEGFWGQVRPKIGRKPAQEFPARLPSGTQVNMRGGGAAVEQGASTKAPAKRWLKEASPPAFLNGFQAAWSAQTPCTTNFISSGRMGLDCKWPKRRGTEAWGSEWQSPCAGNRAPGQTAATVSTGVDTARPVATKTGSEWQSPCAGIRAPGQTAATVSTQNKI